MTGWETLSDAIATDSDQFGGAYLNRITQLLIGADIAVADATLAPTIGTNWTFKSGKLFLTDVAGTHSINLIPDTQSVNTVIKTPAQSFTPDYISLRKQAEELENKIIDFGKNTFVNLPSITNGVLLNNTIDAVLNKIKRATEYYYHVLNDGGTYKAINRVTGNIDSSNSNPTVVIQYALDNSGWQIGSVFLQPGIYNLTTSLNMNSYNILVTDAADTGAVLQVGTGNFPAIIIGANVHNVQVYGVGFYHNNPSYSSALIQLRELSKDCYFKNLEFYDGGYNLGTCVEFYNNAATNLQYGMYNHTFADCISSGFDQNFKITISNTSNWINTMRITAGKYWNSKYLIYSNCTVPSWCNANGWIIQGVMWQYAVGNPTPVGAGVLMLDDIALHDPFLLEGSMFWDLPADRNLVNVNSITAIHLAATYPDKIGGSGAAKVFQSGGIKKLMDSNLPIVQSPLTKRTGWFIPAAGTAANTIGTVGGMLSQHVGTGGGSNTNTFDTTEGTLANFVSGIVAGNYAGLVSPSAGVGIVRRLFGARVLTRVKIDSTTTTRYFFGFSSASALPANNAQPLAVADHGIIVGWNETGTGSTNWSIFHNDGATGVTVDNITGPIAKDALFHTIEINWLAAGNINVIFDGVAQVVSTDLPATTANLYFYQVAELSSTTARTLSIHGTWIEADK